MKILIVSHEYPPVGGGGANACMNLAREYSKAGHKVTIVTVWFSGQQEFYEQDNVKIYRVKSKRKHLEHCGFSEMFDYLLKAKPLVDKLEKENNFDICQVFFGIPSGPLGYYLKKKYKVPYVIRFGGGDIPGFQDRFAFVYKAIGPFIKILWKNADALVANSKGLKGLATDFYNKKEVGIIPNGADVRAFCDEKKINSGIEKEYKTGKSDDGNDTVKLLFVSRLIERKGLQDILPQLKKVSAECEEKGIKVTLDIVGDGPYKETLQTLVSDEGVSNIVSFHGQKSKDELPSFYSNADIFLFPSRKEGMPNAVLEAMSYGLPVIMTPCQGSDELIDGNGYVCTADEFGKRIIQLCSDACLRQKMGAKSLDLILNRFSWNETARKYLKLFGEIVR